MQTSQVNLGIIGCGVIGTAHIQDAVTSPRINLVAIADVRETVVRELAHKFSIGRAHLSAEALLHDDRVEAVVLALPTAGRAAIALRALAKGKHVLIEKPGGMNAGELRQLIAARGALVAGCCQSRLRQFASARAVTEFIATGALGELRLVRCRAVKPGGLPPTSPPPVWRLNKSLNGGGILVNWGCYDLDYLLGLAGWQLRPRRVFAQTWTVPPAFAAHIAPNSDAETHVTALIHCDGGCVISYERGEFMTTQPDDAWQIIGTKGSLRIPMLPGAGKKIWCDEATPDRGVVSRPIWEGDEAWDQQLSVTEDFAAAILDGRPPLATLEHALVFQQIVDAVYASAATGQAIEIP